MVRAGQQLLRQYLTGWAVLLIGGLLWGGEIQLLSWLVESIDPAAVHRKDSTITVDGPYGVVFAIAAIAGFLIVAGLFLKVLFFWRFHCPQCGARAKLTGETDVMLACTQCKYREATGASWD